MENYRYPVPSTWKVRIGAHTLVSSRFETTSTNEPAFMGSGIDAPLLWPQSPRQCPLESLLGEARSIPPAVGLLLGPGG
jgi:hypothetical protein